MKGNERKEEERRWEMKGKGESRERGEKGRETKGKRM